MSKRKRRLTREDYARFMEEVIIKEGDVVKATLALIAYHSCDSVEHPLDAHVNSLALKMASLHQAMRDGCSVEFYKESMEKAEHLLKRLESEVDKILSFDPENN